MRVLQAHVLARGRHRNSRGFSRAELQALKLDFGRARRRGLPIDTRRSSSLEENLEALRAFLSGQKAK